MRYHDFLEEADTTVLMEELLVEEILTEAGVFKFLSRMASGAANLLRSEKFKNATKRFMTGFTKKYGDEDQLTFRNAIKFAKRMNTDNEVIDQALKSFKKVGGFKGVEADEPMSKEDQVKFFATIAAALAGQIDKTAEEPTKPEVGDTEEATPEFSPEVKATLDALSPEQKAELLGML
jgi:hypothetical protein